MNDTIANKFASFKATIDVAATPDYQTLWQGEPPEGFEEGLTALREKLINFQTKAAAQSIPTTGNTAALKALRLKFQTRLHVLARATYRCLTRLGRIEDAAKADLTPSDLLRSRAIALAGTGETILELAEPLSQPPLGGGDPVGKKEGLTPSFIEEVDTLWDIYGTAVGAPTGARARRKALTDSLPQDVRDLEADFSALDDLVIQFGTSPVGEEFVAAWFNARKVIDLGKSATKPGVSVPPAA